MSKVIENELLKALNVSHATAKDDTRPILQGVNFRGNKICALDGYRLSLREIEGLSIDGDVTIKPEGVEILKKALNKKSDNEVDIFGVDKDTIFENENMQLKLHRYVSDYVHYENLIPSDFAYEYEIDKKELLDTLKILKKEFKSIKKDQHPIIKIIQRDEKEFCIGCNINYLIEALKALDDGEKEIKIKMISPIKPIVLTNDDKNLEMVLPIRLVR